ncbi:tRNA (adenosine(37)-N6)-threonylcarbamoyltransferase complex ATPase subunit type 1 TsaE [Nonlabens ponticola]|uniref:tRNA threonylcarbamoyladenosine biosynthesis protein TsaE n=1 Tax=Nonlabens ponticola TaxID=2496866 RepID=A0A3S9MZ39_9FLAO|nr:tRNA (adenosine(37)-N6)-threonylcarbamoyltransferase complex ATPase subunit type 1 TsaE [Nonlabens ponticola]AZQ44418.1 tRNA (adenosine(37)-N6)-threonylcarbamoyltransferase complex ATPase subunit type 1 TsaE [Nonlabens ponticola]
MEYTLDQIDEAAQYVLACAKADTLLFPAEMGTGKTTLIKAICKLAGVQDEITSPTFSLVNEYQASRNKIFHFDLYRIKSLDELHDIGVEDYLDSAHLKLVEWPEVLMPLLTRYQLIDMQIIDKNKRAVRVSDVVNR